MMSAFEAHACTLLHMMRCGVRRSIHRPDGTAPRREATGADAPVPAAPTSTKQTISAPDPAGNPPTRRVVAGENTGFRQYRPRQTAGAFASAETSADEGLEVTVNDTVLHQLVPIDRSTRCSFLRLAQAAEPWRQFDRPLWRRGE